MKNHSRNVYLCRRIVSKYTKTSCLYKYPPNIIRRRSHWPVALYLYYSRFQLLTTSFYFSSSFFFWWNLFFPVRLSITNASIYLPNDWRHKAHSGHTNISAPQPPKTNIDGISFFSIHSTIYLKASNTGPNSKLCIWIKDQKEFTERVIN